MTQPSLPTHLPSDDLTVVGAAVFGKPAPKKAKKVKKTQPSAGARGALPD